MRRSKMQAMAFAGVGVSFMVEIGMFALLGWWGDGKLGTRPWLMVAGTMGGLAFALYHLLQSVERFEAARRAEEAPEEDA